MEICSLLTLMLYVLVGFGLIYITQFAFMFKKTKPAETFDLQIQPATTEEATYSKNFKEYEMLIIQITVMLMWFVIIMNLWQSLQGMGMGGCF